MYRPFTSTVDVDFDSVCTSRIWPKRVVRTEISIIRIPIEINNSIKENPLFLVNPRWAVTIFIAHYKAYRFAKIFARACYNFLPMDKVQIIRSSKRKSLGIQIMPDL